MSSVTTSLSWWPSPSVKNTVLTICSLLSFWNCGTISIEAITASFRGVPESLSQSGARLSSLAIVEITAAAYVNSAADILLDNKLNNLNLCNFRSPTLSSFS